MNTEYGRMWQLVKALRLRSFRYGISPSEAEPDCLPVVLLLQMYDSALLNVQTLNLHEIGVSYMA